MAHEVGIALGDDGELIPVEDETSERKKKPATVRQIRISRVVFVSIILLLIGFATIIVVAASRIPLLCVLTPVCDQMRNAELMESQLAYVESAPIDDHEYLRSRLAAVGIRDANPEDVRLFPEQISRCNAMNGADLLLSMSDAPNDIQIQLVLMDIETATLCTLEPLSNTYATVTWSPDRVKIAFSTFTTHGSTDIFLRNTLGGQPVNLTNNIAEEHAPEWEDNGQWIRFYSTTGSAENGQYRVSVLGGARERLSETELERDHRLSPDNTMVVYRAPRFPHVMPPTWDLFVRRNGSPTPNQLTWTNDRKTIVDWSPDSDGVIYLGNTDTESLLQSLGLFYFPITGVAPELLVEPPIYSPVVSPDRSRVAYLTERNQTYINIYHVRSDIVRTIPVPGYVTAIWTWR